jgi:signal peptidase I
MQATYLRDACCDLVMEVARTSGKVNLRVVGSSMIPTLWPGDEVLVFRCEPSELQPNSIVMFRRNRGLVVHRLVLRTAGHIIARGDALSFPDEPVLFSDVVGRVESVLRNGRPVDLRGSLLCRGIAFVLRNSGSFAGLFLRLIFRLRTIQGAEIVRAPAESEYRWIATLVRKLEGSLAKQRIACRR